MVSSCTLVGGCSDRFLMHTPYCTSGSSFCLQRFPFAASCPSASNLKLAFPTDERQLSRSEASCCHVSRPPDHRKGAQTAVTRACHPFIRSGQNHFARHSEMGKEKRQTEEEAGRQHQGMDSPGVRQVPEGSGEQRKMKKTGCEIICAAPTTLAVK